MNGQRWDDAWPEALALVPYKLDREVLIEQEEDWRAAYENRPVPRRLRIFTLLD